MRRLTETGYRWPSPVGQHATARLLMAMVLCALPGFAAADSTGGIEAALDACLDPAPSLTARIEALAASGWVTQGDTTAGRDRYALYNLMRRGLDSKPGDPKRLEEFNLIRSRPLQPLPDTGGQTPTATIMIETVEKRGLSGFQYELPDQSANLIVRLILRSDDVGSAIMQCDLMLGPALDPEMIATRVPPDGAKVTKDKRRGGPPKMTWRSIWVEGAADSFRLSLNHSDFTTSTAITALLADSKAKTPFSSVLSTGISPVPLR
ncbi:MAG: hypothetical protein ACRCSW_00855 [Tabrizicola sp.]